MVGEKSEYVEYNLVKVTQFNSYFKFKCNTGIWQESEQTDTERTAVSHKSIGLLHELEARQSDSVTSDQPTNSVINNDVSMKHVTGITVTHDAGRDKTHCITWQTLQQLWTSIGRGN